jgi:Squalene-hopene cyclase C-terminal domain/Prenyltransferase and squalene oxidase repeat
MAIVSVKLSEIEAAREKIRTLMIKNVKHVGTRTGWHQYIGEEKVGDVATGQGILIMNYLDYRYAFLPDLLTTLHQGQVYQQGENQQGSDNGGWALLSSQGVPTVEATVWSILGLVAGGEADTSQSIQDGKAWLIANQNEDGGWGPRKNLSSRIYTTFLACRCLDILESKGAREHPPYVRGAIKWILDGQNEDGGWGEIAGQKSSVVHTAYALIALHHLGMEASTNHIRAAVRYLYKQWDAKRMWESKLTTERYEIPSAQKDNRTWARVSIEYFPTPWAVLALLTAGESACDERIFSSIRWLLKTQNQDGSWSIENVRNNRLWAVHDALLALNTFVKTIATSQSGERVILVENTLLISSAKHQNALLRQAFVASFSLVVIGVALGVIASAFVGINNPLKFWIEHYWAWFILGIYILSAIPLLRLHVINWKDAMFGIIIPVILVVLPFFLGR